MRRIDVYGPQLRFAAAHFTIFAGQCEPLHGHNYAVAVRLDGDLTPDSWIFDFVTLREIVAGLCKELDHSFLLARDSSSLTVRHSDGQYEIAFGDRRYVIPEEDVRPLPLDNTTAERLAEWFGGRLAAVLTDRGATNVSSITVTVEEAPGQSASHTQPLSTSH